MTASELRLINLTPHTVAVIRDGLVVQSLPASGTVARVVEQIKAGPAVCVSGITLPVDHITDANLIEGLPLPSDGTAFVVSRALAQTAKRHDVYFPSNHVRDDRDRVIGCSSLGQFSSGE